MSPIRPRARPQGGRNPGLKASRPTQNIRIAWRTLEETGAVKVAVGREQPEGSEAETPLSWERRRQLGERAFVCPLSGIAEHSAGGLETGRLAWGCQACGAGGGLTTIPSTVFGAVSSRQGLVGLENSRGFSAEGEHGPDLEQWERPHPVLGTFGNIWRHFG